jgi:hypothetical protein
MGSGLAIEVGGGLYEKAWFRLRRIDKPTRFTIGVNSTMLCGAGCTAQPVRPIHASSLRLKSKRKIRMSRRSSAIALFSLTLLAIIGFVRSGDIASAADAKQATKKEPWKPEDFIYSEGVGQYRVSPDGKWLAWTKSAGDKDKDGRIANLYLSSLSGDAHEIELTRGTDMNMQPKWSPDGEKIAFMSTRTRPKSKPDTAGMQLWLINAHGGESWHLTDLAHSPKQAEWLDKDTVVFSAEEDPALYEMEM